MQRQEFTTEIGGKTLTAEFTDLADQADGSVIVRYGNTTVMATAVMGREERVGLGYFPLTVDYEEKHYAAGAILGSRFMRREGRPSDEAILTGRIVDRTSRPLFDHRLRNDVQVVVTVLSISEDDPDVLAVIASSLALATSDIPWGGPVSAVRVGKHRNGENIINPTYVMRDHEELLYDVLACGTGDTINMIETKAFEAQESDIQEAFTHALEELKKIQAFQEEIVKKIGKTKRVIDLSSPSLELKELFDANIAPKIVDAIFTGTPGKEGIGTLSKEWQKLVAEKLPDANKAHVEDIFEHAIDECLHKEAVEHDRRPDGRKMDEVRPLFAEARGVVTPMIHGAGVFYRGGTHVFTALTLGGPGDTLIVDSIEEQEGKKRFMHHYNFPPFSVGETGRLGGMNRRAIGHGALAEKALSAVIPPKAEFPYTIRLVSESMASNGSTSMASVCASTLALMDGGVPILRPVAGIAVGLMTVGEKYKVLTDIQGPEDHHGDMDFKVAGTEKGVTAIQMDVKVQGLTLTVLKEALEQGKKARIHILKTLTDAIAAPRSDISPHAPKILTLQIKKDQIGLVIGPGGKTINGIRDDTLVDDITIEENGLVFITGRHGTAEKARDMIADLTHEYIAGEKFEGEVTRILDFGAFVKIGRNTEGLVHISEIAPFHIANVRDALTEGEKVSVIIKEIDDKNRVNLSIKRADPDFATRKGLTQNGKAPR